MRSREARDRGPISSIRRRRRKTRSREEYFSLLRRESCCRNRSGRLSENRQSDAFRNYGCDHCDQLARATFRACAAIPFHFFSQHMPRGWLKTLTHEEFWRMRYGENARDPATARFCERKLQQLRARATPAKLRIDRERTDFRQIRAVVFKGHATHNALFIFMHQEMAYI